MEEDQGIGSGMIGTQSAEVVECTCHMISEGIHIPKAMGVHSNQGFGCDFGCNWERPLGPGRV